MCGKCSRHIGRKWGKCMDLKTQGLPEEVGHTGASEKLPLL